MRGVGSFQFHTASVPSHGSADFSSRHTARFPSSRPPPPPPSTSSQYSVATTVRKRRPSASPRGAWTARQMAWARKAHASAAMGPGCVVRLDSCACLRTRVRCRP